MFLLRKEYRPASEPGSETFFPALFSALLNAPAPVAQLIVTDAVFFKVRQDVVDRCFRNVVQGLLGEERLMGGHQHVGHGDEPRQRSSVLQHFRQQ